MSQKLETTIRNSIKKLSKKIHEEMPELVQVASDIDKIMEKTSDTYKACYEAYPMVNGMVVVANCYSDNEDWGNFNKVKKYVQSYRKTLNKAKKLL